MPEGEMIFTAIDVGTTKVCTVVGQKNTDGGIRVIGHSNVPCKGLIKGNVSDLEETTRAVRESVRLVEDEIGYEVGSVYVGVTGAHLSFENRRDNLDSSAVDGVIVPEDLAPPARIVAKSNFDSDRKVIQSERMSYAVDGEDGIRNPVGMHSNNIQVETHVVTGDVVLLEKLVGAVESAGVKVKNLILEPLASGLGVLSIAEREKGAALVDIGGGTTDVVVFRNGQINYSGVIPVGGYQFTNDIAMTFNTDYETAEQVKLGYADTEFYASGSEEEISLPIAGAGEDKLNVHRMEISQLTRERAVELAQLVKLKLQHSKDINGTFPPELVLTGGTSNLTGLLNLMQRTIGIPVRQGVPGMYVRLPAILTDPVYATSIGILLWAQADEELAEQQGQRLSMNGTFKERSRHLVTGLLSKFNNVIPGNNLAPKKERI